MLNQESCEACRADAPRVDEAQAKALLEEIPEWAIERHAEVDRLACEFKFANFVEAQAFTNKVAELAEAANHHPEIVLEWGKVKVSWWTHKIGGLHRNDFIMAAKTSALKSGPE